MGERLTVAAAPEQNIPLIPVGDQNHTTILRRPSPATINLVRAALEVDSASSFAQWLSAAEHGSQRARAGMGRWQQFVVRIVDERGDAVKDWNLRLFREDAAQRSLHEFDLDVHVYGRDPSYRCFHVDLDRLKDREIRGLRARIIASTGTRLVAYHGVGGERVNPDGSLNQWGRWDAQIDLDTLIDQHTRFFHPFTTTLVEICLDREPLPLRGPNEVFRWA